jgi:hypothetical protein
VLKKRRARATPLSFPRIKKRARTTAIITATLMPTPSATAVTLPATPDSTIARKLRASAVDHIREDSAPMLNKAALIAPVLREMSTITEFVLTVGGKSAEPQADSFRSALRR